MAKVWVTSDPHFGHNYVARTRGFPDTDEHDGAILDAVREKLYKDDTVIWLGDLALARPEAACRYIAALPGTHDLVLGNHDKGHPMYRDAPRWQAVYRTAFRSVSTSLRRKAGSTSVLLSHFPYDGDHTTTDREQQYRLRDLGLPIVHGHTHAAKIVTRSQEGTLQVHVGWDTWGGLVDWDEVVSIVEEESP